MTSRSLPAATTSGLSSATVSVMLHPWSNGQNGVRAGATVDRERRGRHSADDTLERAEASQTALRVRVADFDSDCGLKRRARHGARPASHPSHARGSGACRARVRPVTHATAQSSDVHGVWLLPTA